jgi:signal transduction histidine kinase/HPt (histidine-containing phosphotransfer) domain-containing protein
MSAVDEAVRRRFLQGLPERRREIATRLGMLASPARAEWAPARDALDESLHRLAGTAATLGFGELSRLAKVLERQLRSVWDDARALADHAEEDNASVQSLLATLDLSASCLGGDGRGTRVLVVDDDPDIRAIVGDILRRDGRVGVLAAATLREVEVLGAFFKPHLVLLDVRLEPNVGPAQTLAVAKRVFGAGVRVAFCTTACSPQQRDALVGIGAIDVIEKPFDPPTFANRVVELASPTRAGSTVRDRTAREVLVHGATPPIVVFDAGLRVVAATESANAALGPVRRGDSLAALLGWTGALADRARSGVPGVPRAFECFGGVPPKRLHVVVESTSEGGGIATIDANPVGCRDPWTRALLSSNDIVQGLVHNVMNPLAAMQSALRVVAGQLEPGHSAGVLLKQVEPLLTRIGEAMHATALVTRPALTTRVRVDAPELLEAIAARMSRACGAGVSTEYRGSDRTLLLPVASIEDVLGELVMNAHQAGATKVAFEASVTAGGSGTEFFVVVRDDGQGVDEEHADRLFEPFFSTRDGHVGLGLTRARKRAREAGGDVTMTVGDAGKGACFVMRLRAD